MDICHTVLGFLNSKILLSSGKIQFKIDSLQTIDEKLFGDVVFAVGILKCQVKLVLSVIGEKNKVLEKCQRLSFR